MLHNGPESYDISPGCYIVVHIIVCNVRMVYSWQTHKKPLIKIEYIEYLKVDERQSFFPNKTDALDYFLFIEAYTVL